MIRQEGVPVVVTDGTETAQPTQEAAASSPEEPPQPSPTPETLQGLTVLNGQASLVPLLIGGLCLLAAVLLSGPLSKALGRKFRREKEDRPGGEGNDPKP